MDRLILLDADGLLFKGIEDLDAYKDRVDEIISNAVNETDATHYKVFIEHKDNYTFRKILYPSYKSNRKKGELPINYLEIKDYIINEYYAHVAIGVETDDAIISTLKYVNDNFPLTEVILAVNDKDYKTFPCVIYDLYYGRIGEITEVDLKQSQYNFWHQMLSGDSSDGVKGIVGLGSKGAEKLLKDSKNYFITTYRAYLSKYKNKVGRREFEKSYNLLKLRDDVRYCKKFEEVKF